MINGFDSSAPRFLADLSRIQDKMQRAERQITSGLRVESGSDAPEQVLQILRLRSGSKRTPRFKPISRESRRR